MMSTNQSRLSFCIANYFFTKVPLAEELLIDSNEKGVTVTPAFCSNSDRL